MPDKETYPLIFNCHSCLSESSYPNYLKGVDDPEELTAVVKRCLVCGLENKIDIPKGYKADELSTILRGYNPQ